jgi:HAD superfamily hydrolase (TIGR01509 family)
MPGFVEDTLIGALFDWDGVIIDSSRHHELAWDALAQELGQPLPDGFFKATFGMRNDRIIPEFTSWAQPGDTERIKALGDHKEALYRESIRRDGIDPLPGVISLLEALGKAGIPCAVGSSTSRENILTIMNITGLARYFRAICAERDVTQGKPAPDVFATAARMINRDPRHCVVFEDAHVGVEAGKAAGALVIAVATTHPRASFFATADLAVESLSHVTVETIRRLITERNH